VKGEFPKWCWFCEDSYNFDGSKARNDHIASHFEEGCDMTKWKDLFTTSSVEAGPGKIGSQVI
jgi:hypothetical protein